MEGRVRVPGTSPRGAAAEDVKRAEVAFEELLSDHLDRIRSLLGADTVAVLLLDDSGEELVARAAKGLEEEVEQGVRIPFGKGFAGRVAASRSPVILEDVDHADVLNPILREKGIKSMLGVPLEVGDKLLGVLHVGSLTPRRFTDADITSLRRVARTVAIPVEQAKLYGTERGARVELEAVRAHLAFLAEASGVLGSSLDYATTLASVARLAVPALADWCVIDVVDDGDVRRVAAICADPSYDSLAEELIQYPSRPDRAEGTAKVLRTARSELVEEVSQDWLDEIAPDERHREILSSLGLRSNILVPLVARGRTLGVLTLATAESGRIYGDRELRLAEELAARAALAVDNARLFRDAEESLGLLDALFATAPVGLAFFDRDLRYLKVNDTLAALSGVSPEGHIGRTVWDVIPTLAPEIEPELGRVLESSAPSLGRELHGQSPSTGEDCFWLTSYYPVCTTKGETVGVGVVIADLTDRVRAERRLAAQYDVTRILSTSETVDVAVEQILEALCERLDWSAAGFWTGHEESDALRLERDFALDPVACGPFVQAGRELGLVQGSGFPGRMWETGEPEWISALRADSNFLRAEAAEACGLRSGLAFPVVLGSQLFGVFEFFGTGVRPRDEELLRTMSAIGSQVGQFVERTRAEEKTERAQARLSFLAEASRLLASSLDYDTTLERIAQLTVPTFADWCGVEIVQPDGSVKSVALAHVDAEKAAWARELYERYPADPEAPQGTYAVLRTGQSLLVPEIPDEMLVAGARDEEHLGLVRGVGIKSWIAAPLPARDRSLGVLSFITTTESGRVYDDEDLAFAEDLARRAGAAVENAELFRAAVENEERQRFLADVGSALASSLDFHIILESVARLAVPLFADWCIVDVRDGEQLHRVAVAAGRDESREALEELRRDYPPSLESPQPAAQALRENRTVIFSEFTPESLAATTRDERHLELMRRLRPVSAIATPLVARGHVVGAITFAWAESGRRYTDTDIPLAEEIAHRAALAVDNARLHRETEERARAALVLSHVGDGVFMVDQDGVVRLWNRAAQAITGLDESRVVGGFAADVIPGWKEISERIPVAAAPAPAARRAETLPLDIAGRELWLSITGVGLEEGTVYAFRDLTEERMLEKIRSDFVATISHELRTPLASVYGAALTLIEREATLGHEHRARLLGVIASEADRLAHIVDDVLLASRLDSRRLAFSIESCDAMQALERTVEAARAHLPAGVRIKVEVGDAFPPIAADAEKLRQILGNLIDNAVKYSPNGGLVDVSVEQRGQRLRFTVRDQGIGIPPEERERIFEKFYRLDPDLLRGVGGTGLGLYISRELTQRMGGAIWVDSAHGGGSIFYLELPLAFAPQEGENGRDGREAVPARVADQ